MNLAPQLEYWNVGILENFGLFVFYIIPILHHSNIPFFGLQPG